jgi:glucose/arabinose dehydrogenase
VVQVKQKWMKGVVMLAVSALILSACFGQKSPDQTAVIEDVQALWHGAFGRIRSMEEGPDGSLYLLTNNRDGRGVPQPGDDRLLRLKPIR